MMQLEMRVSKMAAIIGASTFTAGVSLIFVGLFFGLGFNQIAVLIFYRSIPFTKIFYIAALVGKRVSFRTDYKYAVWGNYVIIYKVGEEYVEIYRVVNRYRDITRIFD